MHAHTLKCIPPHFVFVLSFFLLTNPPTDRRPETLLFSFISLLQNSARTGRIAGIGFSPWSMEVTVMSKRQQRRLIDFGLSFPLPCFESLFYLSPASNRLAFFISLCPTRMRRNGPARTYRYGVPMRTCVSSPKPLQWWYRRRRLSPLTCFTLHTTAGKSKCPFAIQNIYARGLVYKTRLNQEIEGRETSPLISPTFTRVSNVNLVTLADHHSSIIICSSSYIIGFSQIPLPETVIRQSRQCFVAANEHCDTYTR